MQADIADPYYLVRWLITFATTVLHHDYFPLTLIRLYSSNLGPDSRRPQDTIRTMA